MAQPLSPTSTTATITTMTTAATSVPAGTRSRNTSAAQQPLIVRALYDYHSTDPTNLSFQEGTLIRVLTQLQSGWWDGCIDGERGWFPCNFVTEVTPETLAMEEDGFLDVDGSDDSSEGDEEGDEEDGERALLQNGDDEDEEGDDGLVMIGEEFTWIPQADKEGRTFFLNTVTGETSWELPNAQVFVDWDDNGPSDEEVGGHRSSMDSENSEDILMSGPPQGYSIPEFKEFNVHHPSYHLYAETNLI